MTHLGRLTALLIAVLLSFAAAPATAQNLTVEEGAVVAPLSVHDRSGIDYDAWAKTAARAEEAVENSRASNDAMESLRDELAVWRQQFLDAQTLNVSRIATVREQLDALGPAPAEGASEAEDIAARRSELTQQLESLQAPGVKAGEAYRRADGIIGEIDALIRSRQADELMRLGPSPLNPTHWGDGLDEFGSSLRAMANELKTDWQNDLTRDSFNDNLPATVFFLVVGLVLVLRGRAWAVRLTSWMYEGSSQHRQRVLASVVSLTQVVLPFVGILALVHALRLTDMLALRTMQVVDILPRFGMTILAGAWLAGRVFPRQNQARPIIEVPVERRAEARFDAVGLATVLALVLPLEVLADYDTYSEEAMAVLLFPLIALAGLGLFRIGQMMNGQGGSEDDPRPYRSSIIRQLGRLTLGVAIIAPLLAGIGYTNAAQALVFPAIVTLAILALVALLQRFVADLYVIGVGGNEEARDNLVPVLLSFGVILSALPVLALVWGARLAELSEMWTRFVEGFEIGDTRISPSHFITFAAVFAIAYSATRLLQGALRNSVLPKTRIDPGAQTAIVSGTGYVGVALAAVLAISAAGLDLSSIAIVAGALSVGIGFGLQNIVSNFVSGIILLIERPVREGDWIEVGGTMGTVRDISVRSTRIETFDRTDVIVPNSDLISNAVTNWTKHNLSGRLILNVGVAYGTDTKKVETILREIGEAHPLVIVNPPPLVVFKGFGADALDFELRVILRDINFGLSARTALNHEIARRFAEEGIEIPFAQRDIWLRNPEALQGAAAHSMGARPAAPVQPAPDFDKGDEAAEEDLA